ncbi:MAG: hypothetical protein PVH12_00325 [Candidatus Bathyarchaeota archaeon]|jgi:hypothetical protein
MNESKNDSVPKKRYFSPSASKWVILGYVILIAIVFSITIYFEVGSRGPVVRYDDVATITSVSFGWTTDYRQQPYYTFGLQYSSDGVKTYYDDYSVEPRFKVGDTVQWIRGKRPYLRRVG